ncbi:MAG: type I-E CRISPR-associated protein Cas6/Cse3/CasE [Clostridiales bacterium]|nr:type I-E CRISPR-associated protein Cas6/Cse3/CasE [Clostridiales bacterium]
MDLVKAVYEGTLTVESPELFVNLLCHGMGREKAYGFGMMTVIRG